ncbi:MAG: hypothetical protein KDK70_42730, partial [Myxococcales bacterium]|nr:hypothetical protein [Myxococcales bacterium]
RIDETITIYETKVLPTYQSLGDRHMLVVDRGYLALHLLTRNAKGDRKRAGSLLKMALADAKAMRLPEADVIVDIMIDQGFEIRDPG